MNIFKKGSLVLGTLLIAAACQDLEVTNQNAPGPAQALSTPEAVENVVTSAFGLWWGRLHNSGDVYNYYPDASGAFVRSWSSRGVIPGQKPRVELENDPEAASQWIPRASWDRFASSMANANDGLRVINDGMRIEVAPPGVEEGDANFELEDQTDRVVAFARFMQGLSLGYMGLVHDQAAPANETTVVGGPLEWEGPNLTPYDELIEIAVGHLEQAIEVAETTGPWVMHEGYIHNQVYTNEDLIKAANTLIARLLVLGARTPEERAAVDWARVRDHALEGLDFDFGPEGEAPAVMRSLFIQRVYLNINNGQIYRVGPRVLGMADVSGNFHEWLSQDLDFREAFNIDSPDIRAQGPLDEEGEPTAGAYWTRNTFTIHNPDRGSYLGSFYIHNRRTLQGLGTLNSGLMPLLTADENRLYLAEAYIHLDQPQLAADLINETRMRPQMIGGTGGAIVDQGLDPVTADGVPQSDTCVPRAYFGAAPVGGPCGTLTDALVYERAMELMDMDPMRAWMDFRGFGFLPEGQLVQMPVPGRYLVSMALPIYTFGGIGGEGSAPGYPMP